jgi:hypothetical protein
VEVPDFVGAYPVEGGDIPGGKEEQYGRRQASVAREALRRQLRLEQFESLRKKAMPFAEARGYLTDQDVFSDVS